MTLNIFYTIHEKAFPSNETRPYLRELQLIGNSIDYMRDQFYEDLVRAYGNLTHLWISAITMDGNNFRIICDGLKYLRELSIDRVDLIEIIDYKALEQLKGLRKLTLFSYYVLKLDILAELMLPELAYLQIEKVDEVKIIYNNFTPRWES